jgi:hypothetical protein
VPVSKTLSESVTLCVKSGAGVWAGKGLPKGFKPLVLVKQGTFVGRSASVVYLSEYSKMEGRDETVEKV